MPFPFYWGGAVFALGVFTGVVTAFVLAMLGLDRAASDVRTSILPGLVGGLRSWATDLPRGIRRSGSPTAAEASPPASGVSLEDGLDEAPVLPVHPRRH